MRAALLWPLVLAGGCTTLPAVGNRATVLAVDDQQRSMVAASDVAGLERLAHANLRINAPVGRVLTRDQVLANMRSGEIAAEGFERTAEDVSISGNVAVVMGREVFTPATNCRGEAAPAPLHEHLCLAARPLVMAGPSRECALRRSSLDPLSTRSRRGSEAGLGGCHLGSLRNPPTYHGRCSGCCTPGKSL